MLLSYDEQLIMTSPLTNTYRLGCDDVLFSVLVETGNTLDGHVVGFCGTRGKHDVFRLSANEVGDML